jgi:hypothetical protein
VGLLLRLAKNTAKLKLKCGLAGSRVRETGPGLPPSAFCLRASDVEWSPEHWVIAVALVGSLRGPGLIRTSSTKNARDLATLSACCAC